MPADSAPPSVNGDLFRFSTQVRVRFAETDAQGLAHHAVYLVWFEVARIDYLARFDGGYPGLRERGVEALTTEVSVTYLGPARFNDTLDVRVRCADLRGARLRFEYLVERERKRVAEGSTLHACVHAQTMRPIRVPSYLVEAIFAAEAKAPASSS